MHTAMDGQRNVPLEGEQTILGNANMKSTMRYAHIGEESHIEAIGPIAETFMSACR